ncbi:MAG: DUF3857 domain-containing protein [Calditrichaceae bacterium]
MNFKQLIVLFILAISIFGCSSNKFTVSSFLEKSGRSTLPTQSEFPEDGAVYLYENTELKMFFDDKWQASVEKNYHAAILYFNDKAESYLTPIIYLNKEDKLVSFKAKTIKPNGEILELTRNDLHANQISSAEFTDNESVKFTFPGVESGCVVEYQYSVMRSRIWIHSQRWKIQDIIPKLYTKYAIEFPQDYLNSGHGWNFLPVNINLSAPKIEYHMKRSGMLEYGVAVYSWELENILGMKSESYMPPYEDVAQYLRVDFRYDSWNDLSEKYWKRIKDKFQPQNISDFNKLRKEIVGDATSDAAKIDSIFSYLQTSYRYVSSDIDNSGTIPHDVDEILRNKYGDCKDLSVLGTALLTSARVEAYPALVKTNTKGILRDRVVLFDFNHMIIYTKASDGKEYWLDATGNSCNLGETYPMIEGTKPLVLYNDGRSEFKKIPASKSHENLIFRNLKVNVDSSGNFTGNADILFKGNYNLIVRSGLRSLSKSEMEKAIQKYVYK